MMSGHAIGDVRAVPAENAAWSPPVSLPASAVPRDAQEAYALYADFVWRTLQRFGIREADLEDVLQEVFMVVHRQLGAFGGRSQATTWLYGIALRVASTHRRRAWVRRELPTAELPEGPSTSAGPEQSLGDAEERRKLTEILDLMDLEKRAIFVMFELDEMPCEEIAQLLGVPVGTVHSRLHAARRDFRGALKRWQARRTRPRASLWPFGRSS
jgi:RNA polymerase sigma-70 factor (ECF subfamily)